MSSKILSISYFHLCLGSNFLSNFGVVAGVFLQVLVSIPMAHQVFLALSPTDLLGTLDRICYNCSLQCVVFVFLSFFFFKSFDF